MINSTRAFIIALAWAAAHCLSAEEAIPRDPFWPVEYNTPKLATTTGGATITPAKNVAWPDVPIKGISRGRDGAYMVLVDGVGIVRAGEDISIKKEDLWFHWHVTDVNPSGLRTVKLGATRESTPPPFKPPTTENAP